MPVFLPEIKLRHIAAINFYVDDEHCELHSLYYPTNGSDCDGHDDEVTSFVIIYCGALEASVRVVCETSATCRDLVLSLRLVHASFVGYNSLF